MSQESRAIAETIERNAREIIEQLQDLPDEVLNRATPIPDSNTLFGVATHTVGMGEFWVLQLVGGQRVDRVRALEFRAKGSGAELIARIERWIAALHDVLDELPDDTLDELAQPPSEFLTTGGFDADESLTKRQCLLHVLEHTATHLGHIQLTRQLFDGISLGLLKH